MASAYCRNCGQQIDIAASFCTFCGAAQAVSSPPVEPARQPPPVMPTQASPPVRQLDQVGLPVIDRFGGESQQADMGRALDTVLQRNEEGKADFVRADPTSQIGVQEMRDAEADGGL